MRIEQRVQVEILGAPRYYSYAWYFNPAEGIRSLQIGDKVEIPPNQVQEEGGSGTVVALGTAYLGDLREIVRVIKRREDMPPKAHGYEVHAVAPDELALRRPAEDDMWGGIETR